MQINIIVLLAIFLIQLVVYVRSYEKGLCLAVFFLVLLPDTISLQFGPAIPTFTIHRLIVALTCFFWARNASVQKDLRGAPLFNTQCYIAIAYLISTVFAGLFLVSFKRWLYYAVESFLMFWMVQSSLTDRRAMQGMIRAMGIGLLGVSVIAFVERYSGYSVYDFLPSNNQGYSFEVLAQRDRTHNDILSTYPHRILLGIGCGLGLWKFFTDFANRTKLVGQAVALAGCIVCAGALYFSMSRGPWVSFAAAVAWLSLLAPRIYLKKGIVLGLVGVAVLASRPGAWSSIRGLGRSTVEADTLKGSSFRWRMTVVNMALERIAASDPIRFLFGYGGGSHIYMSFGEVELSTGRTVEMESWDCELAVNLYEQGVLGGLFIGVLYMTFLTGSARFLRGVRAPHSPEMVFAIGVVVIILVSKMSVRIFAPQLVYAEAVALAIGSNLLQSGDEDEVNAIQC